MLRNLLYSGLKQLGTSEIRKFDSAAKDLRTSQTQKLLQIISANSKTTFGKENSFTSIDSIQNYQSAIPIRDYEEFRPYIERMMNGQKEILTYESPKMYATTSGTSSEPKYIPVTESYMKEFRKASIVSGYYLAKNYPKMANGVVLSMVSSAQEGLCPDGTPYGAISGQLYLEEPFLVRKYICPMPYEVYLLKDYETRYYTLLRIALCLPLTCFYTLNPSTILMLVKKLKQYAPSLIEDIGNGTINPPTELPQSCLNAILHLLKANPKRAVELQRLLDKDEFRPATVWPDLQVVACWTKAAASFYLADFPKHFDNIPITDITYGASEGRGTVFCGDNKQILSICSHFFEFIPEDEIDSKNPTALLADELETGKNYYILFTTSAGLYRYHINDVVKITGYHNGVPMLEFQYKGGNISSFTGEKVTELQVTNAMSLMSSNLNMNFAFFTVVPEFSPEPHYEIWLESLDQQPPSQLDKIANIFDECLGKYNIEYKTKRESQRLGPIQVQILEPGTYYKLRRSLCEKGVSDSQIKVSHLNPKPEIKDFLYKHLMTAQLVR